ncbi:MAG: DNA-3-methyladenine glycosylase family protein [Promethearchaeota archaeon]
MIELEFKEDYNLSHTFDCGQIFRFQTFDNAKTYYGPLLDRVIRVRNKKPNVLEIASNNENNIMPLLRRFFRMKDNYFEMLEAISIDPIMKEIVKGCYGLHILKQDVFECCIAYLLSQNSSISRITKNLFDLAKLYGKKIEFDDKVFYLFPNREDLLYLNEEDFRKLGYGYRAKYIFDFVQNYPAFLEDCRELEVLLKNNESEKQIDFDNLSEKLKKINGIGQKVADCIQMFAFGDLSVFIVDRWMKKFMIKNYYKGNKKNPEKEIRELGNKMFGKWAGYAQEFIFRYIRCFRKFI